ncbi:uncharacterized protein [Choristoneura fumiferana]|uniref:uncharacterized protein n=1 Tax=Choristoneura fumiferana TaxID=7141 RepID=UPI003D1595AD
MKCRLALLLLLVVAVSLDGVCNEYRSDYSFVPDAGGWLKLHRVPANWHEARLRCHLEGGTLASPVNRQMSLALKSLMEEHNLSYGLFTGIHATFSRGDFASVEGVPLARIPLHWAAGEPDNAGDAEQCVLLLPNGAAADVPCSITRPYACFRKKTPDLVMNACGTFDNGYTLDTRTGSCYKFHTTPRTWSRAYMACAAEGAHLAVINSEEEAAVIRAVFARFPHHLIPTRTTFGKEIVFLGFQSRDEPGEWMTVHGQTLEEAGYSKWFVGEPNNYTVLEPAGEKCGAVYRLGVLDDLGCEGLYSFICEMTPGSLQLRDDQPKKF